MKQVKIEENVFFPSIKNSFYKIFTVNILYVYIETFGGLISY